MSENRDHDGCIVCQWDNPADCPALELELLLSDSRGVYIPQNFAEISSWLGEWAGIDPDDLATLLEGPDGEWYWEAWNSITDNAVFTLSADGSQWRLHQDGDLWLYKFAEGQRQ